MIPLVLLLIATASQAQPDAAKPDVAKADAKICRSHSVIGSRVKRERICRTRAEWQGLDDDHRRVGTELVERSRLTTITR